MSYKSKVAIFGSCISRDIFNYKKADSFIISDYYARSSFASIYGLIVKENNYIDEISSSFQKKIVKADLNKYFVERIGLSDFDILLIDFIDERFNLYLFDDGSVCTLSSELVSTGFLQKNINGRIVLSGSEEFFGLWQDGWNDFIAHMKILGVLDRVRLHKSFWSYADENGIDYIDNYKKVDIDSANHFLTKLYIYAEKDLKANQIIEVSSDKRVGSKEHRWGRSPFHFVDEYYKEVLTLLYISISSGTLTSHRQKAYDPYALHKPIFIHNSIELALEDGMQRNGIHQILIRDGQYLDICIQNIEFLLNDENMQRNVLVGFSGAVSNRQGKRAPFFSGLGISNSINLPIISISDLTLSLDTELPIGWYAGNEDIPDFPFIIANLLDNFAINLNAKLLLFGGSAGGFAALVQSTLLKADSIVVVWNPQTSIENYVKEFVEQYCSIAYSKKNNFDLQVKKNREVHQFVNNLIHNICNKPIGKNIKLLYLQNQDDWHVQKHYLPYIEDMDLVQYGNSTFIDYRGNKVFFLGNWGKGHIAPSNELVKKILTDIIEKDNVVLTAWMLDQGIDNMLTKSSKISVLETYDKSFSITCTINLKKNTVHAYCNIDDRNLLYAFYLISHGERHNVVWYGHNNNCEFLLPDDKESLEVVCFVKDIFGTMKHQKVPVIFEGTEV